MGALIWRELVAITRTPAYWVSAAVYVVALAAFVVVWGDGIPVVGARSSWEQFAAAQRVFLAVLLPWIAVRCGWSSRHELALVGFVTAQSPAQSLLAKSIALTASLLGITLSALPVIALMQHIAAVEPLAIVSNAIPPAVIAAGVAVVTTAIGVMLDEPLRVWGLTTVLTLAVTVGRSSTIAGLFLFVGVGTAAALYLVATRSRLIYLPETEA